MHLNLIQKHTIKKNLNKINLTSIEFLKAEYIKRGDSLPSGVFEDAKEMHKKEIIDAIDSNFNYDKNGYPTLGEQYYQKKFERKVNIINSQTLK